jgi:very-short-patch-repair endonuclease
MTLAEIMLWNELKRKQMMGYDFDRQRPIDEYIVDFYCKDLMLAIEIDGESHIGKETYDKKRDERLDSLGVRILHFDDLEVRQNLDGVVKAIEKWIIGYEAKLSEGCA